METLKGLDLVENVTKPVPDTVTSYYKNTFANGTGEFGTFTMQDFLGSAVGTKTQNALENTSAVIANMNVTTLTSIYADMLATVSGTYGPNAGPITIPSGPAAGVYALRHRTGCGLRRGAGYRCPAPGLHPDRV